MGKFKDEMKYEGSLMKYIVVTMGFILLMTILTCMYNVEMKKLDVQIADSVPPMENYEKPNKKFW